MRRVFATISHLGSAGSKSAHPAGRRSPDTLTALCYRNRHLVSVVNTTWRLTSPSSRACGRRSKRRLCAQAPGITLACRRRGEHRLAHQRTVCARGGAPCRRRCGRWRGRRRGLRFEDRGRRKL